MIANAPRVSAHIWFKQGIADRESTGKFNVVGYCKNDADPNIKCCLSKDCASKDKTKSGKCLNNPGGKCSGTFVTGQCPGPGDVQCCLAGGSATQPLSEKVEIIFWINAFIPLNAAGVTRSWAKNPGKTVVEVPYVPNWVPIFGSCYATDQRGFDSTRTASARMHSQAEITMDPSMPAYASFGFSQESYCGQSTAVDCDDGKVKATKTAEIEGVFVVRSGSADNAVIGYKFRAADPLVPGAPKIDLEGVLSIDRPGKSIQLTGKVDDFPAFEAYVIVNGGSPQKLAQLGPKAGAGLASLAGAANRDFYGTLDI